MNRNLVIGTSISLAVTGGHELHKRFGRESRPEENTKQRALNCWASKTRFAVLARTLTTIVSVILAGSAVAEARITLIQITRIESPTFDGASFGAVGQYEKLVGRAFGEINPNDQRNSEITDINFAARNARGLVEYSTDIYILRPIDRSKGNHRLFFEI